MSEIKTDVTTPKISGNTNNQSNDTPTSNISKYNNPYEEPPKNSVNNNIETIEVDLDLDSTPTISESGILKKENIDFSRIAATADKAINGNFIDESKVHTEYWGCNGDLTYKIHKSGAIAVYDGDTLMGFTDTQGIGQSSNETPTTSIEKEIAPEVENVPNVEEKAEEEKEIETQPIEKKVETENEEKVEDTSKKEDEIEETVVSPIQVQEDAIVEEKIEETNISSTQEDINVETQNETSVTTIEIPIDIRQTGICKNNTPYSHFYSKWNKGTLQRVVADMWDECGRPNKNGIATLNDRYLVAVSSTFGQTGDIIDVVLRDGTIIPCIIGDAKGVDALSPYGHILGNGGIDIIEWEAFGSKEEMNIDEWHNKGVQKIINKGSILPD